MNWKPLVLVALAIVPVSQGSGSGGNKQNPPTQTHVTQVAEAKQAAPEAYFVPWDNWLKSQGSPISGRDVWEAQQETKIQGEVLICITYAETNLGKVAQRGSTTNVGSVGSYDATDTTHSATSIKDGLVMIGRTLNNANLGHKTTIAQLSRKSEPYGAIYAASTENWERNVLSCMSKIKGKPIGNQFEFRVK